MDAVVDLVLQDDVSAIFVSDRSRDHDVDVVSDEGASKDASLLTSVTKNKGKHTEHG